MTIKMQDVKNYIDDADPATTVQITIAVLERMAQHGREGWELLAEKLKASEQWDEISSWLDALGDE